MPAVSAVIAGASAVVGTAFKFDAASKSAQAQEQIAADERAAEAQRQKAAALENRRRQLEIIRQQARARALALSTATNQGAAQGSGLQSGYAQIAGQTSNNLLGLSQNYELGQNMFAINADISSQRTALASASSQDAFGSGLMSLGNSLVSSLGPMSRLAGTFGGAGTAANGLISSGGYGVTGGTSSYDYIG